MMQRHSLPGGLLLCAVSACGVASTTPDVQDAPVKTAPAAAAPAAKASIGEAFAKPDGATRTVDFATGAPVVVEPLLITGRKPGVVAECAVRIAGRMMGTIGHPDSPTEVLLCYGLREIGALPPAGGRRRMTVIYATGSPNVDYRTPVVLIEDDDGVWSVDEAAFDQFDGADPKLTVAAVARALTGER